MKTEGICWIDKKTYLVPSMTQDNRKYIVRDEGFRWVCNCPDSRYRMRECKHVELVRTWTNKPKVFERKVVEEKHEIACPFCNSSSFRKDGNRKVYTGKKQRYLCKGCNKRFIEGVVKNIKGNSEFVIKTLDLYFKGNSYRDVQDHFKQIYGFEVSQSTLYRWVVKYCRIMLVYTEKLQPKVSKTWHTDEQMVIIRKEQRWVWNTIDRETKFLLANQVTSAKYINDARRQFRKAKERAGFEPKYNITDGLAAYRKATIKEFHSWKIPKTEHIVSGVSTDINNNIVERFHNSFREREKTMRGLHSMKTAAVFSDNHALWYNFVRPNMSLGGLTPAQAAGIDIGFTQNRWQELLEKSMKGQCAI